MVQILQMVRVIYVHQRHKNLHTEDYQLEAFVFKTLIISNIAFVYARVSHF